MNEELYEIAAATIAAEEAEAGYDARSAEEREEDAFFDERDMPSGDYLTFMLNEERDHEAEEREYEALRSSYWAGLWE